jgi:DNA-directed RNA polymerase specialized sigma24 family protein
LTPTESQPNQEKREETADSPHQNAAHSKWVLSIEALNKLLDHFSLNREEAGRQYELMRLKLVRYFEWRSCPLAEDFADEAINRVARKIDNGERIHNLPGYFLTVGRLIFMEWLRERERTSARLDEIPERAADQPIEDEHREARLRCLDHCLSELPVESRCLVLTYHSDEGRAKIDRRRQMAEGFGIPLNALRIRAHRIRIVLEKCLEDCLAQPA